jgi:cobalt-zinc-cadmium efflux system outer membrane protein
MPVRFGAGRNRPSRARTAALLTGAVLLLGAPDASGQNPVPKRPLGSDLALYVPEPGEPQPRQAPQMQNPTGSVSLRDAVALALVQNPALAAFAWEIRAREARVLQAGRPPNPTLGVLVEDFGTRGLATSGVNEPIHTQATIQLSQLIELGGKRAARERVAAGNRNLAAWDYEAARIDVLTEVTRAFTDVLAAQETVAHVERTTRLVDEVQHSVSARVVAGVVSPIEDTRAGVAVASVRIESARARRSLDASRIRLALLWGSSTPAFTAADGSLQPSPAPLPPFSALTTRLEQSPELARWAAEVAQREAVVAVERSKAVPDVSVIGGYRRFTDVDANAFVVGAAVSLPFFDKNRDGVQEAQSRVAKAYEERRAATARVSSLLADAYAALASADDEVNTLRTAVLPGSQQAFDAVSEGYRLGRFGYTDVLEAQRTLVNAGGQYLRALSSYHKAVASVERLIGAPLTDGAGSATAKE